MYLSEKIFSFTKSKSFLLSLLTGRSKESQKNESLHPYAT